MVPDKKKSYKWLMIPVSFVLLLALIVYTLYDNGPHYSGLCNGDACSDSRLV